jgi:hypothetical protein
MAGTCGNEIAQSVPNAFELFDAVFDGAELRLRFALHLRDVPLRAQGQ